MIGGRRGGTGHSMGPVPRPIGVSWMPCGLVRAGVCVRGFLGVRVRVCLCVCAYVCAWGV